MTAGRCQLIELFILTNKTMNNIDNLLRKIKMSQIGDYSNLSEKQREMLGAIHQMFHSGEAITEKSLQEKISEETSVQNCFWGLWKRKILVL